MVSFSGFLPSFCCTANSPPPPPKMTQGSFLGNIMQLYKIQLTEAESSLEKAKNSLKAEGDKNGGNVKELKVRVTLEQETVELKAEQFRKVTSDLMDQRNKENEARSAFVTPEQLRQ